MNFYFHYPFKPFKVTQEWGIHRPDVYGQFGFTKHNGTDANNGDIKYPIYCPFPAQVVEIGFHPKGSGIYLSVLSLEEFEWEDGRRAKVLMDFLHLFRTFVPPKYNAELGEVLCLADNTGFSTGTHTHIQPRRVTGEYGNLTFLDKNDANGSFDVLKYKTEKYALNLASWNTTIIRNIPRLMSWVSKP